MIGQVPLSEKWRTLSIETNNPPIVTTNLPTQECGDIEISYPRVVTRVPMNKPIQSIH